MKRFRNKNLSQGEFRGKIVYDQYYLFNLDFYLIEVSTYLGTYFGIKVPTIA